MNNQKIKHLVSSCSLVVLLSLLTGCDNTDYKTRIQKENDNINPNGNRAICLAVGEIYKDMYPYTIHYLEGEIGMATHFQTKKLRGKCFFKFNGRQVA